jgi:hypothetical protein
VNSLYLCEAILGIETVDDSTNDINQNLSRTYHDFDYSNMRHDKISNYFIQTRKYFVKGVWFRQRNFNSPLKISRKIFPKLKRTLNQHLFMTSFPPSLSIPVNISLCSDMATEIWHFPPEQRRRRKIPRIFNKGFSKDCLKIEEEIPKEAFSKKNLFL